jgi:hypothetical protein
MFDYDNALEIAQAAKCEPILHLISWSENYSWNDPSNPLVAFYAITQIEGYEMDMPSNPVYGYVEIGYLGEALSCYADRPQDVEDLLWKLQRLEDG